MNRITTITTITGLIIVGILPIISCKKKGCIDSTAINYNEKARIDNGTCFYSKEETGNTVIEGSITSNTTWTNDKVYELKGKVVVDNSAILTIEEGTIIKGQEGTGTNSSALIIARGSQIMANGTASNPIIFTSVLDNIQLGETSGTNLDETDNGKWGGVILLGSAPISAADGDTETQIEGIPATETYGTYGGENVADNSGKLSYVSIRHAGTLIGAGNEINGLTLGGVGNGTIINNIEVLASLDDGIELFGGTVNVNNIMIAYQNDDGIDIDMNYSGTINNFTVVHGIATDEALEIDGPEGVTNTNGLFTLSNGTIKTIDGKGTGADLKSKAQGTINNVVWEGYRDQVIKIRASFSDVVNCVDKDDAYVYLTQDSPKLFIQNSTIISSRVTLADAIDIYTNSVGNVDDDNCTVFLESMGETTIQNSGTEVSPSPSSVGAEMSSFDWTWVSKKGKL